MAKVRSPVFTCPFCGTTKFKGPIGKRNLDVHVSKQHKDKLPEYIKMKPDEFRTYDGFMDVENPSLVDMKKEAKQVQNEQQRSFPILQVPDLVKSNATLPRAEDLPQAQQNEGSSGENEQEEETMTKAQDTQPQNPSVTIGDVVNPKGQPVIILQQPQQQQQVPQTPQRETPLYPDWNAQDPIQWFELFMRYYQFKPVFQKVQLDRAKRLQQLPNTAQFMSDLKTMDSGQTSLQQIQYIAQEYDAKIQDYMLQRQQPMMNQGLGGMGIPLSQLAQAGYNPPQQQGGLNLQYQQPNFQIPFQNETEKRLLEEVKALSNQLNAEKEKAQQERTQLLQNQIAKLEATLEQQKTQQSQQPQQTTFEVQQLRLELKAAEDRNNALTQDIARERDARLSKQLEDIQRGQPNMDEILAKTKQLIAQEHDVITARDIDAKIQHAVQTVGGTSQLDVDLKKADHEFELKQAEIATGKENAAMWQETIKDIAGTIGGSLSQALAGRQQGGEPNASAEPETSMPIICPSCKRQLIAPVGLRGTICPNCNAKISISPEGMTSLIGQTPPPMQPMQPVRPPAQQPSPQGVATITPTQPVAPPPRMERNIPPQPDQQIPDDADDPDNELQH